MSRIGKKVIVVPSEVKIDFAEKERSIVVKGPKGELALSLQESVDLIISDTSIEVKDNGKLKGKGRAFHGMTRSLLANMVHGVSKGFEKELVLSGVGYEIKKEKDSLRMNLGKSHPVLYAIPEGIEMDVPKPVSLIVKGIDKHKVGHVAAEIRALLPLEPYKGKGFRYKDEVWKKKIGKSA